jgi:hypothetical protein
VAVKSLDHFERHAAGIGSLDRRDPERVEAEAHARGCSRCAEALRQAEHLMQLIDAAPPPSLSPAALEGLSRRVTGAMATSSGVSGWVTAAVILAMSLVLALVMGHGGGTILGLHGVQCVAVELVTAAVPYGILLYYSALRGGRPGSAGSLVATAAAGAFAGQLYLLVRCPDRMHTPHLLVLHTGAVVLAALLGWIGFKRLLPRLGGAR